MLPKTPEFCTKVLAIREKMLPGKKNVETLLSAERSASRIIWKYNSREDYNKLKWYCSWKA